jgi:hypothetical protein
VVTNLIVEEGIPDIFHHFRHSQNVILRFLVAFDTDATVEHAPVVPGRPESAGRQLARPWVGIGPDHPLEQIHPPLALVLVPFCITVLF